MILKNLTLHEVTVVLDDATVKIEPSGQVARVKSSMELIGAVEYENLKIPLYRTVWGEVENLPEPEDGVIYIVSSMVLSAAKNRNDLVAPDTSPSGVIRNENGEIVGVKGFQTL